MKILIILHNSMWRPSNDSDVKFLWYGVWFRSEEIK